MASGGSDEGIQVDLCRYFSSNKCLGFILLQEMECNFLYLGLSFLSEKPLPDIGGH